MMKNKTSNTNNLPHVIDFCTIFCARYKRDLNYDARERLRLLQYWKNVLHN